jgi:hypothetical protein
MDPGFLGKVATENAREALSQEEKKKTFLARKEE